MTDHTTESPLALHGREVKSMRFCCEMLAQVSDAVIVIDLEERISYLNPAAERLYQVRASEVRGRKLPDPPLKKLPPRLT